MLIATDDLKTLTSPAGSAIVFSIQLSPVTGQLEDLTDRAFVFAVYDSVTNIEQAYWDGDVDPVAQTVTWRIFGDETRSLYGIPTLKYQIAERQKRGGDDIASGAITITQASPRIDPLNNASISRHILRIVRIAPAALIRSPRFIQVTELYQDGPIVPPGPSATIQNTLSNSQLLPAQVAGAHELFVALNSRIQQMETAYAS